MDMRRVRFREALYTDIFHDHESLQPARGIVCTPFQEFAK